MFRKILTALARLLPIVIGVGFLLSILVTFGSSWWFFDLFSHFRVQYVLAGFLVLPLYLLRKRYWWAAVIGVAIVVHTISIWPYLQTLQARAASHSASGFTIVFANIYYKSPQFDKITALVQQNQPEVIVLAELQKKDFDTLVGLIGEEYPVHEHFNGYGAYDISYLSKATPVSAKMLEFTQENPSVLLTYLVEGKELHILGIHPQSPVSAETTDLRNDHLTHAFQYVTNLEGPVVLFGDFNISQFSPVFQQFIKESGMRDTQLEFGLQPSWHAGVLPVFRIPIDQAVVSSEVLVHDRFLGDPTGSDHFPLVLKVGVE